MPALRSAIAATGPAIPPPMTSAVLTSVIASPPQGMCRLQPVQGRRSGFGLRASEPSSGSAPGYPRDCNLVAGSPSAAAVRGTRARWWCCRTAAGPLRERLFRRVAPFGRLPPLGRYLARLVPGTPRGETRKSVGGHLVEHGAVPRRFRLAHGELVLGFDEEDSRDVLGVDGKRVAPAGDLVVEQ